MHLRWFWDGARLHGLNGSGRWPQAADREWLRDAGVAALGWPAVTVPGAVDAWATLHGRFGSLPVDRLLAAAIGYADQGFPVSPVVASLWRVADAIYEQVELPELAAWAPTFAPGGSAPSAGTLWGSSTHAQCLRGLAERGLQDFYEGQIAEAIVAFSDATGGRLTRADLASHGSQLGRAAEREPTVTREFGSCLPTARGSRP